MPTPAEQRLTDDVLSKAEWVTTFSQSASTGFSEDISDVNSFPNVYVERDTAGKSINISVDLNPGTLGPSGRRQVLSNIDPLDAIVMVFTAGIDSTHPKNTGSNINDKTPVSLTEITLVDPVHLTTSRREITVMAKVADEVLRVAIEAEGVRRSIGSPSALNAVREAAKAIQDQSNPQARKVAQWFRSFPMNLRSYFGTMATRNNLVTP